MQDCLALPPYAKNYTISHFLLQYINTQRNSTYYHGGSMRTDRSAISNKTRDCTMTSHLSRHPMTFHCIVCPSAAYTTRADGREGGPSHVLHCYYSQEASNLCPATRSIADQAMEKREAQRLGRSCEKNPVAWCAFQRNLSQRRVHRPRGPEVAAYQADRTDFHLSKYPHLAQNDQVSHHTQFTS